MDLSEFIASGTEFFSTHPWIAVLAAGTVLALFYWNSKAMFRIIGILLLFAIIYYLLSFIGESTTVGLNIKRKLLESKP